MNIKGLTLIELLVVISIIVIASGAVVLNGSSSKSDVELLNTKNLIISNISRAKEMALSGVGATLNTNYGIGVWFPDSAGGYYYIYRNNETAVAEKGCDICASAVPSTDVIIEKITLPDGIKYTRVGSNYGVLFTPPTPHVAICTSPTACTAGPLFELDIVKKSGGTAQRIKVNKAGLIE
ncbi:MAG TPA: type II secretion system protein [Candidatus Pacearchaeota archaeon]|nr:type II secretion system protein [Candidatus Pacearchaeota archaeon]